MQFDEDADAVQQIIAGADHAGVVARRGHRLGQGDAVVVGERPGGVRVDDPSQQAAAQARDAKPRALLLGEGHDSHGSFGPKGLLFQQIDGGQRGHDAQRPVVTAAVRDGIQVTAGHDGTGAWLTSWVPPGPQVAVVIWLHG